MKIFDVKQFSGSDYKSVDAAKSTLQGDTFEVGVQANDCVCVR